MILGNIIEIFLENIIIVENRKFKYRNTNENIKINAKQENKIKSIILAIKIYIRSNSIKIS